MIFMFATASSVFFIERLGRRPLLMSMAFAQAIAMMGIAISTEISHDNGTHIPGIVATVFICFYFCAYGFGWVATPWLYPAEVNSLSMRTKGAALATACDWLFNYIVVQTTPIGIHYLHWGLYLVYAVLNASFVPLIYFLIVETAGKSLEQIDRWFAQNPGWLVHKASDSAFTDGAAGPGGNTPLPRHEPEETQGMVKAYREENQRPLYHYDGKVSVESGTVRKMVSEESLERFGVYDEDEIFDEDEGLR